MRSVGEARKKELGVSSAYEALVDQYSPGMRLDTINREFALLRKYLPAIIQEAKARQENPKPLQGPFPVAQQKELCNRIVTAVGFDFNHGRFDFLEDGHPTSDGSPDDVRITAGVYEDDFLKSVYDAAHEAGHAMYEQGRPAKWRYQPAGGHLGMGVHESQSMIIEDRKSVV